MNYQDKLQADCAASSSDVYQYTSELMQELATRYAVLEKALAFVIKPGQESLDTGEAPGKIPTNISSHKDWFDMHARDIKARIRKVNDLIDAIDIH